MDSVHMTSGTNGDAVGHNSEFSNLHVSGDSPEDSRPKSLTDRSTDGVAAGSALNPSTLSSGECERIARDACKLRGLSAFSGERSSLLRCVGGDGEAGASYMNKLMI